MSGFTYIIASTRTVQSILKEHNQQIDERLMLKTENFKRKQIEKSRNMLSVMKHKMKAETFEENRSKKPKEGMALFRSSADLR